MDYRINVPVIPGVVLEQLRTLNTAEHADLKLQLQIDGFYLRYWLLHSGFDPDNPSRVYVDIHLGKGWSQLVRYERTDELKEYPAIIMEYSPAPSPTIKYVQGSPYTKPVPPGPSPPIEQEGDEVDTSSWKDMMDYFGFHGGLEEGLLDDEFERMTETVLESSDDAGEVEKALEQWPGDNPFRDLFRVIHAQRPHLN